MAVEHIVNAEKGGATFFAIDPESQDQFTARSMEEALTDLICLAYEEGKQEADL